MAQDPSSLASPSLSRLTILNRSSIIPAAQGACWLRLWHRLQDKYKFTKSPACCLHNPLTSRFLLPWFFALFSSLAPLLHSFCTHASLFYLFSQIINIFSTSSQWDSFPYGHCSSTAQPASACYIVFYTLFRDGNFKKNSLVNRFLLNLSSVGKIQTKKKILSKNLIFCFSMCYKKSQREQCALLAKLQAAALTLHSSWSCIRSKKVQGHLMLLDHPWQK